jgi:hypothetical protein
MTWIPITERKPEPFTKVLVTHNPYGDRKGVAIAEWFEWTCPYTKEKFISWHQDSEYVNVDGYDACINHDNLNVTHWKPLIDPA